MRNLFYVSLFLLFGCDSGKKRPDDFQFQLIDVTDSYNSETGKFLRESVSLEPSEDTVVYVSLTPSELDSAYGVVYKNNFFSLPETIECDNSKRYTVITVPSFDFTMQVRANGRTKKVTFKDGCSPKKDLVAERDFKIIEKKLRGLVYRKSSIENLPSTKIVFL